MADDTIDRIRQLAIEEFSLDAAKLDPKAPLDEVGIDSLAFIEFMFKVEDEFGIKVTDDELRGVKCFADLERLLAAALQAQKQ